jgi:hypothetical protein
VSLVVTGAAGTSGRLVVEERPERGVPAGEIAAADRGIPATDLSDAIAAAIRSPQRHVRKEPSHVES